MMLHTEQPRRQDPHKYLLGIIFLQDTVSISIAFLEPVENPSGWGGGSSQWMPLTENHQLYAILSLLAQAD